MWDAMDSHGKSMHEHFMSEAIKEAHKAAEHGEVPVGAVIVKGGVVISRAANLRETENQASAHAEMLAIDRACKALGSWRLSGCDMYVTLEPCAMCAGALIQARIDNLFFGAVDDKSGAVVSNVYLLDNPRLGHTVKYEHGILTDECADILKKFFSKLRK